MKNLIIIFIISMVGVSCSNKVMLPTGTEYTFFEEFQFKFNSDSLFVNESKHGIDSIINVVKNSKNKFEIGVHSGIRGSDSYNLKTTKKRAKSLQSILKKKNKKIANRIVFRGYGESQPIFKKDELDKIYNIHGNKIDEKDKRQNRRVILRVIN